LIERCKNNFINEVIHKNIFCGRCEGCERNWKNGAPYYFHKIREIEYPVNLAEGKEGLENNLKNLGFELLR
jgi:hypothetical protein